MEIQELRNSIKSAQRIVFKFGTNVLSREDGNLALPRIASFVESIAELKKQGKEIIIVTSGAVGLGAKKLKLEEKPTTTALKQACASVGQARLMYIYEEYFDEYEITTAQVLLTENDFSDRNSYLCLRNSFNELLQLGVIPIVNQNDTVTSSAFECNIVGYKVCFDDNDKLSALLMSKLHADLLVMLTDVDGVFNADPRADKNAKIIPLIEEITPEIEALGFSASKKGRGGMKTKIAAAKVAVRSGGIAVIANGKKAGTIDRIFKGEEIGTIFKPIETLSSKKRWIAYATNIIGQIIVNEGAQKALVEKNASLLPAGIVGIKNYFEKDDVISIVDENGNEFAKGQVNYSHKDCEKLKGKQTDEIEKILGYKSIEEVIARDNIVIL